MYKLIALDMDGTLLNEDMKISRANYEAIQKAKERGIKVVLATGRPINGIGDYLKELNLNCEEDYAIAFNGSLIQNTQSGHIINKTTLLMKDLDYIYKLSKELDINLHVLTDTCVLTSNPNPNKYTKLESEMNQIPLNIVDFDNLDPNTTIVKLMFADDPKKIQEIQEKLPTEVYEKYTVVQSSDFFLEFLEKSVNKGSAVQKLAKLLSIKQEEIICVGNAGNDIHMIQYAGLGVAMGNSFPEVKKQANYITYSNDEDGVAHVIDKFMLNPDKMFIA